MALQRGSLATLPHPRSHPTHLAGGEGNECLISANQAAVLVRRDSRGHGQRTGRDVCPVLTTSSSASGWGNQRQPAGDVSWGSRHSQPGSPSEPGELRALPLLTPVQDPSPAREQTQGCRHAQLPGPWKGPGLAWADEDWSPHQCFSVQGEPGLLLLLSERKHFSVRSGCRAQVNKKTSPSCLVAPGGRSSCRESRAQAAASWNGSDCPSHCGACSQHQTKALETARSPSDTPITSAQAVLRPSPSHPTKAGFLSRVSSKAPEDG